MSTQPRPSGFNRRALIRGGLTATAVGALGIGASNLASASTPGKSTAKKGRAAEEPRIYSCEEWEARPPDGEITILDHVPTFIVVHHTADPGNSEDYSLEHAKQIARDIQNFHMDGQGWGDTGQQFTNSRGGYVLEGRHESLGVVRGGTQHVQGANVGNHNSEVIGIENEGIYVDVDVPQALWDSLVQLVAWIATQYDRPLENIQGHRDFNSTECPGQVLYDRLQELRDAVADVMGVARVDGPGIWPLLKPRAVNPQVRAAQHLLRAKGFSQVPTDGVFGSATKEAVVKLTEVHKIKRHTCSADLHSKVDETGFLGSDIWPLITPHIRPGENDDVAEALATLRRAGGTRASTSDKLTEKDWKRLLA
ncbi:N-acetylmuramoyl-L-alanine amidase [Streptomyces sp. NPDC005438]|uniref:peptidoglycan recognition protein family protein n=1 Tax=Streptomyces sp. NPDC005438 TaxID=3156880 RepID=UPI0033A471C1